MRFSILVNFGMMLSLIGCRGGESAGTGNGVSTVAASMALCEIMTTGIPLPTEVRETSGLARSVRDPGLFWTHNDSGHQPEIFAIDTAARLVQRVAITGATLRDWEDIEAAPCEAGACLYIADIGDNNGRRKNVTIFRVTEPMAGATQSAAADALHARFPDGARDAEALFAGRSGDLYIVTKGRREEVSLYRYPAPQRPGETVTLERVRQLFPQPRSYGDWVTAATASPDGRWVGVRTYTTLYLYPMEPLIGNGTVEPMVFDLTPLSELQGESLSLGNDGEVWLTTEAEDPRERPRWSQIKCTLPT